MAVLVRDIQTLIINKLNGVSGLNGVYAYFPDRPTNGAYPYAIVSVKSGTGEFGDTIRNIRHHVFEVKVFQERTEAGFGNQKSERIIDEIVDEVLVAFDADTTLSGSVKMVKPLDFSKDFDESETGDQRIAVFVVDATVVVPSTT